jgi:hypothetical protein
MNTFLLGYNAEKIAERYERERVDPALRHMVRLVSHKTRLGYDIESVDVDMTGVKKARLIEVKTLNPGGEIYLSSNEVTTLLRLGDIAWIYVVDCKKEKIAKTIRNPLRNRVSELIPVTFKLLI